jgi:hypothetical protein
MLREPAVAGQFYPADSVSLTELLTQFCSRQIDRVAATGIMVPHAGYVYSGAIAGKVFDRVTIPNRVILLGPNHHGAGHPGAVYASGRWKTPLGEIDIDAALAQELIESCSFLQADTQAHRLEHSLEVQVPFIQHLNPQATLVPICLGHQQLNQLLSIAAAIADAVHRSPEPVLLIASSDMTHFESAKSALLKDRMALDCIEALNPEGLFRTVVEQRISMCGFIPTVVMLKAALLLGATQSEIVAYGNSGDVTNDYNDVVAYAAALVSG